MQIIPVKDFFFWEKQLLSKGGDIKSLNLLLDVVGGISHEKLNTIRFNREGNLLLRNKIDFIESIWEDHLLNSVPIQYLCGFTYWRDLKLMVSEKVLIPRPETEIIIDIILDLFNEDYNQLLFAELGTGSGAISIALSLAKPCWEGIATDIDINAINIASRNYVNSSNQSNLKFFCGHWLNPLENLKGKLDLVISNPPYIPKDIYKTLPKAVKNFEPKIALMGGEDGLDHIKEIIQNAPYYLREYGWLILENHFDQGTKVKQLFLENGFTTVKVLKDYSGIGRFTIGRYK